VEEAQKNPKIEFILESELRGFYGNGKLEMVELEHLPTGKRSELKTDGTFIFAGYQPNTEDLAGLVQLNGRNEIVVDSGMKTNVEGVFAAGDCIAKKYRQVTTAVADGTIAALSAADFLRNNQNANQNLAAVPESVSI
jgi:thioredoxin reductase (NADPH)